MRTIRQQLRLALIGGMLALSAVGTLALYSEAHDEADEQSDLLLRQVAATLPAQLSPGLHLPAAESGEDRIVVQAWSLNGVLLYSTRPDIALPLQAQRGHRTVSLGDAPWVQYTEWQAGRIVQVAQPAAVRKVLAADLAVRMLLPFALLLALLGGFIFVVVGRVLRPLEALAQAVGARSPLALAPLELAHAPPDLVPIIGAINGLMGRVDAVMRTQRHFIDDAAHELRSPLTALKLQLQLAERADTQEQRGAAFAKIHSRLDRSSHLVQQLLTLARHEPGEEAPMDELIDLAELARGAVVGLLPLAEARAIDLGVLGTTAPAMARGNADALAIAVNNLVDNAIRYTQHGGRVDVQAGSEDGCAFVRVSDNGPGVSDADLARLFDRFYRAEGNAGSGCGLGLAIVKSVAGQHGATVRIERGRDGIGLVATLRFACP
ncbi:MAG: ATP-binding protein [Pseudomonadota bacterium]